MYCIITELIGHGNKIGIKMSNKVGISSENIISKLPYAIQVTKSCWKSPINSQDEHENYLEETKIRTNDSRASLQMLQKIQNTSFVRKKLDARNIKTKQQEDDFQPGGFCKARDKSIEGSSSRSRSNTVEQVLSKFSQSEKLQLNIEQEMLDLDKKLREALSVKNPNHEAARKYLDRLSQIHISELMLKKNPHIVDAVKKCIRYRDDSQIRMKAELVYENCKSVFSIKVPEADWDSVFINKVTEFVEACKILGIRKEMLVFLVQDPTKLINPTTLMKNRKPLRLKSNANVSISRLNKPNVLSDDHSSKDDEIYIEDTSGNSSNKNSSIFQSGVIMTPSSSKIVGRVQPSRVKKNLSGSGSSID